MVGKPSIRRRCDVCRRRFTLVELVVLRLEWASDLVQEQYLCERCIDEVPAEVLDDVPHQWVGAVA